MEAILKVAGSKLKSMQSSGTIAPKKLKEFYNDLQSYNFCFPL